MSDWRAMMRGSSSPTQYPQNPQKGLSGGHSEDIEDFGEGPTDKPDILAEPGTVSVPVSGIPPEISATQTDGVPLLSPPQNPQNPQNGSGVEVGPLPEPPLKVGWLVAYKDRQGRLRGGCDEREAGTVSGCEWNGTGWTIYLLNGTTIPLRSVSSVGVPGGAAWDVKRHGFNGNGRETR